MVLFVFLFMSLFFTFLFFIFLKFYSKSNLLFSLFSNSNSFECGMESLNYSMSTYSPSYSSFLILFMFLELEILLVLPLPVVSLLNSVLFHPMQWIFLLIVYIMVEEMIKMLVLWN